MLAQNLSGRVEKIVKGSLDLIPSPSPTVKIHFMGGRFAFTLKANFTARKLNFH